MVLEHGYTVTGLDSPDNNLEAVFRYLVTDKPIAPPPPVVFGPPEHADGGPHNVEAAP